MERIFKEHYKRKVESLNGEWRLAPDKDNVGKTEQWYKHFPENYRYVNVPSCWNLELDLADFFGTCWYSRDFEAGECYLELEFGAVSGYCEVYLDGEPLCSHYGGWSAFKGARHIGNGTHTVTVMVDASSNTKNTIPLQEVDWYHYGGIVRSVEASSYRTPYIAKHRVSYELNDSLTSAVVSAEVQIENPFNKVVELPLCILIDDEVAVNENISVGAGERLTFQKSFFMQNISLWDTDSPRLYDLKIETDADDIIDRIGFRKIEVRGKEIFLNGRSLVFRGVNRHEEHPDWGFAVPANINKRDLDIIKNLNCNIVRGAHYPQSHTWVDYLDREGMLFWSEIPMWGFMRSAAADPLTIERGKNMHTEMIEQYFHHPSIIIWGLHNEICTDFEEGYNITKEYATHVRVLDNSRLITYASDRLERDTAFEFVDFVSLNNYYGWYRFTLDDWVDYIKNTRSILEEKGVGDKPVVMSEFGCGGLYGFDDFGHTKWTMKYQSDLIEKVIRLATEEDGFCGTFVWQFADVTSDVNINRARGFNNKGILNEYRRPKRAYETVKELYREIKENS